MNESGTFSYTEREKEHLMEEAGKLERLTAGFAEGWKTLNRDIGGFIPFILIMVSIIIMPLFADDDQTGMKEFCRSAMKGKKQLDTAGMITAYGTGSLLYLTAILIYSVVKMIPFGTSGALLLRFFCRLLWLGPPFRSGGSGYLPEENAFLGEEKYRKAAEKIHQVIS